MHNLQNVLAEFPSTGTMRRNAPPILYQGFSGADIWSIETDTGRYAVRCWPAGINEIRLTGLHCLLKFLRERGLNFVAVPILTARGMSLVKYSGRWIQVEPWLPGHADFRECPTRARLASAMAALARWHLAAAQFQPAPEHRTWFASAANQPSPAVIERRDRLRSLNAAQIRASGDAAVARALPQSRGVIDRLVDGVLRHADSVLSSLELATTAAVPLQPVLRDVWHDHLLFTGDEITGLIDPFACRSESVAADLARLLGSLAGDEREAWDFALRAYQKFRPLSLAEKLLIPVLDRSGLLLSGVTWLEWLGPLVRFSLDDGRVVERVAAILKRLDAMG